MNLFQMLLLRAGASGGGDPLTTLRDWDFTTSVPSGWTLDRAADALAIQNGVVTTVAAGAPRVESWQDLYDTPQIARGLRVDPARTPMVTWAGDYSNAAWSTANNQNASKVVQPSQTMPDGSTATPTGLVENTATGAHTSLRTGLSMGPGEVTWCAIWKPIGDRMAEWEMTDNLTATIRMQADAAYGGRVQAIATGANASVVDFGIHKLANGWWLVWAAFNITTVTLTQLRQKILLPTRAAGAQPGTSSASYAGDGTSGIIQAYFQAHSGRNPFPLNYTGASLTATTADVVTLSDVSWLPSSGTIVIDHDRGDAGVTLLGSGANVVAASGAHGWKDGRTNRIAIAYNGSETRTTIDGAGDVVGSPITFGANLRLLGTSAGVTSGRIRRIRWYASELTQAQRAALTAPVRTLAGTPGQWRFAGHRDRIPHTYTTTAGAVLNCFGRFGVTLGGGNRSKLRLSIPNFAVNAGTGVEDTPGNSIIYDEVALERSGGPVVPVTFSGSRSITVTDGQVDVQSDDILPSAFGLSEFTRGDTYFIRYKAKVTTAGHRMPLGRTQTENGTAGGWYNPAATTVSAVDATGAFTVTGTAATAPGGSAGLVPILIGVYTSTTTDPATWFSMGDSILDNATFAEALGNWLVRGLAAHPDGQQAFCYCGASGRSPTMLTQTGATRWRQYLSYANIYFDAHAANYYPMEAYPPLWEIVRGNPNMRSLVSFEPWPRGGSSDSWATYANQTFTNTQAIALERQRTMWAGMGPIRHFVTTPEVRGPGVEANKWLVNGTANYTTQDGTHPTNLAHGLPAAGSLPGQLKTITDALTQPV